MLSFFPALLTLHVWPTLMVVVLPALLPSVLIPPFLLTPSSHPANSFLPSFIFPSHSTLVPFYSLPSSSLLILTLIIPITPLHGWASLMLSFFLLFSPFTCGPLSWFRTLLVVSPCHVCPLSWSYYSLSCLRSLRCYSLPFSPAPLLYLLSSSLPSTHVIPNLRSLPCYSLPFYPLLPLTLLTPYLPPTRVVHSHGLQLVSPWSCSQSSDLHSFSPLYLLNSYLPPFTSYSHSTVVALLLPSFLIAPFTHTANFTSTPYTCGPLSCSHSPVVALLLPLMLPTPSYSPC